MTTSIQVLEQSICRPTPEEVEALNLTEGIKVSRLTRLRIAENRPLAIERASLPHDIVPNPMAIATSLYKTLESFDVRPVRARQKISALILKEADAALLDVPVGAAGLKIERLSYLQTNRVIEFTRSVFRGDAYDFVVDLHP